MWGAYFTPNLVLPLALGGALAYIKSEQKYPVLYRKLSNVRWLYASMVGYIILFYFFKVRFEVPYFHELFDEYLFAIVCFFIILRASDNSFRFAGKYILEHDVITFTGKISYGLYLYHLFVIGFFWNFISPHFQVHVGDRHAAWIIYFIIAYLIAIPSYYLIETPLNNLKKYFKY
jgi:peptidoglycan/LPS O-acetylase OafA/YrhL